jgi:hypothetical protein
MTAATATTATTATTAIIAAIEGKPGNPVLALLKKYRWLPRSSVGAASRGCAHDLLWQDLSYARIFAGPAVWP